MGGWMFDMRNFSRRRFLVLAGAAGASLVMPRGLVRPVAAAAAFPAVKEEDAVVAFGYVGPVSDEGWTWSHNQGMQAIKAAYPKVKTLEVENIPYSADATRIFR